MTRLAPSVLADCGDAHSRSNAVAVPDQLSVPSHTTPQSAKSRRFIPLPTTAFAVPLLGVLFLSWLGHRDLTSSHEARAAQNAQRMLDTGEWGLPVLFDGRADLQKPPGYYWLVAGLGALNGGEVNAYLTRLPAALTGLLSVLLVYAFLKGEGRPTAAAIAALSLATAIHFTAIARTARIDVPLTCAVAASLLAYYCGSRASVHRFGWHAASAVAASLGVMLKGPIALALIGPVAVCWLVVNRNAKFSFAGTALGIGVVAALTLPWFLWVNHTTNGEFARVFFWHHNVERFAGGSATLASHPWWYYVPRFAVDFLPWTPALALLAIWLVRSQRWRGDPHLAFGFLWFAAMFAVLSAARFKRADYLLPLFPGAAIVLGCAAEDWLRSRTDPRAVRRAIIGLVSVAVLVVIGWQVVVFAVVPHQQAPEEKRAFAEAIRELAPPPQEVMIFRAESHLLSFHLGRPLRTRVEWHDLNDWLAEPGPHVVVMPPEYAYAAQQIVTSRKLVVVAALADFTARKPDRPLVILRTAD